MGTNKLIRIDELSPEDIARAKATLRQSWEMARQAKTALHYGLVTAQIDYIVSHGSDGELVVANTYIWQEHDVLPNCPVLLNFLGWWRRSLDGQIYNIKMWGAPLLNFASLGISAMH